MSVVENFIEQTEEGPKGRLWTEIEQLRGTRFGSLLADLRELEEQAVDLTIRMKAMRDLIEPLAKLSPVPARALDRQARWVPPSETLALDKAKLIRAGVTPEQLAAGTVKRPKKGYLEIRKVKPPEEQEAATTSPESQPQSESVS